MFDVLDELDDAIDKVAGSDAPVDVARLRRLVDRAELLWLRAVRDSERAGEWQAGGAVSPAAWLRERCGLTHGTASAALRQGRMLETMPEVAGAFAEGEISRQHVAMIEQACTPERRTAIEALDVQVADVARNADPQRLRQVMRRIGDALDGDGGAANDEQQHERRRAHLSRTLDGMGVLDALLDPEGTEVVLTALDAVMERDRDRHDGRSTAQRRADALVELCRVGVAHADVGPGRRTPPQISAVVDLELLEGRARLDLAHTVRAEAAHGGLSVATLRRLACDARIARVITTGRSQPLDVGRAARVVSPAQWRALAIRDGGCVAPGCDRPPGWCEAHHRIHWLDGGATDLDNLELRCHRHHRHAHGYPSGHDPP